MVVPAGEDGDGERLAVALDDEFVGVVFFVLLLEVFYWHDYGSTTEFFCEIKSNGRLSSSTLAAKEDYFVAFLDGLENFLNNIFLGFSIGEFEWGKFFAVLCGERP